MRSGSVSAEVIHAGFKGWTGLGSRRRQQNTGDRQEPTGGPHPASGLTRWGRCSQTVESSGGGGDEEELSGRTQDRRCFR